jgi:hypothetical protein
VLGRPHLAALGALALIVMAGIVVLAFAALRGKSDPGAVVPASSQAAVSPAPAAVSPPPAVPDSPPTEAAPPPAPAPPSAAPPAPGAKPTPAATTVGQMPAAAEKGVATAGAGPAAAKPAGRGAATTGVSPGGSPTRPAPVVTETAPAPATPPEPAAVVPPLTFNQVRLLVADGDRGREREGMLQLGNGLVSVLPESGGAPMLSLANGAVTGIFYSRSKQPRWKDASGETVESKLELGRLGFLRGDRNWVVLLTAGEPVILRIEDSALRTVLPALQERTGHKVQR